MKKIFWGMLLVFLEFGLNIGDSRIGLIPDFVGYFLIYQGLEPLVEESGYFAKARPWAIAMTVYSGARYVMSLFGMTLRWTFMLSTGALIVSLLLSYWILKGILEMELQHGWDLQGQKLNSLWLATAVVRCIAQLSGWIPVVGILTVLAMFIVEICYLVAFNTTKNLYLQYTEMG